MASEARNLNADFHTIFGSEVRIDIWGRIAQFATEPPEQFTGDDIKKELEATQGLSPKTTASQIKKLETLEMIERLDSPTYDRRVHYRRLPSDYWLIVEAAVEVALRTALE